MTKVKCLLMFPFERIKPSIWRMEGPWEGGWVTGNQIVQQIAKTAGLQFGEIYLFDSSQDCLGIIQTKVLEVVNRPGVAAAVL